MSYSTSNSYSYTTAAAAAAPPSPPPASTPASASTSTSTAIPPVPAPPSPTTATAATPTLDTTLACDFPSLARLSRAEVEGLLAEPEDQLDSLLEAYILTVPQVQTRLEQHEQLLRSIETKAQRNEAEQAPLEALRRETERYLASAQSADQIWSRQLEPELQEAYRQFTPGSLHAKLAQGTSRIWDQSEELANAYVEKVPYNDHSSPPDTTTFLRLFQELRTRYHRRALLAERWSQGTVAWPA